MWIAKKQLPAQSSQGATAAQRCLRRGWQHRRKTGRSASASGIAEGSPDPLGSDHRMPTDSTLSWSVRRRCLSVESIEWAESRPRTEYGANVLLRPFGYERDWRLRRSPSLSLARFG